MPSTLVLVIKHWVGSIDSVPTFSKTGGLTKCWGNLKNAVNVSVFAVLIQWISVRKRAGKINYKFKICIFWNLHIHNLKSNSNFFPDIFFSNTAVDHIVMMNKLSTICKKKILRGVCESQKIQEGGVHFAEKLCTYSTAFSRINHDKKKLCMYVLTIL